MHAKHDRHGSLERIAGSSWNELGHSVRPPQLVGCDLGLAGRKRLSRCDVVSGGHIEQRRILGAKRGRLRGHQRSTRCVGVGPL